jgi:hypothetical protein
MLAVEKKKNIQVVIRLMILNLFLGKTENKNFSNLWKRLVFFVLFLSGDVAYFLVYERC